MTRSGRLRCMCSSNILAKSCGSACSNSAPPLAWAIHVMLAGRAATSSRSLRLPRMSNAARPTFRPYRPRRRGTAVAAFGQPAEVGMVLAGAFAPRLAGHGCGGRARGRESSICGVPPVQRSSRTCSVTTVFSSVLNVHFSARRASRWEGSMPAW